MLKAQDWAMEWKEGNKLYSGPKPGWKKPGDIHYWFLNLYQCNENIDGEEFVLDTSQWSFGCDE